MQKLLDKKTEKINYSNDSTLTIEKIEQFYTTKKNKTLQYGLEYERISLDKKTHKNASYTKLKKIIEHYSLICAWELVFDNNTLIGAKNNSGSSISLEPGNQLEISLCPKESIIDIDIELTKIVELLDKIAEVYDVIFVGYGFNPSNATSEIEILNKTRYRIMDSYLPYCTKGELVQKMMRQTAGIQVNIDYLNKKDAYLKLLFFNLISPFTLGLFSNSPIENNSICPYKSNRGYIWMYSGENRCNFFYKNIFNKFFFKYSNIFKNYINEILDIPMVYIERDNKAVPIQGKITFREFMNNGFLDYKACYSDYILHQSLCFPDVRLKNYIEIRNHDSSDIKTALGLCAFYKGLSLNNIQELLSTFSYLKIKDIPSYNKSAAIFGLDFTINKNKSAWEVVEALFELSAKKLNSKEKVYLNPIYNLIKQRKTKADIAIEYGLDNIQELISYLY